MASLSLSVDHYNNTIRSFVQIEIPKFIGDFYLFSFERFVYIFMIFCCIRFEFIVEDDEW